MLNDTQLYIYAPGNLSDAICPGAWKLCGSGRGTIDFRSILMRLNSLDLLVLETFHLWFWMGLHCLWYSQWAIWESSCIHNSCTASNCASVVPIPGFLLMIIHHLLTRLDYCSTFYMGLPLRSIQKLQLVENAAMWAANGVIFWHVWYNCSTTYIGYWSASSSWSASSYL